uniref:SUMO specific peptidase 7 n=1 Tax=Chelydra serpentina TaxID=8475 RepID=A0A8C3RPL7_CHESE
MSYCLYGRQPKVMLTNVLRTEIGRKYTQSQLITDANLSDVDKLQSDRPPSSSVANLEILQILNPPLQSLFISKRQPKVILKNVLRMKIGRKYIKRQLITDANLSDADKLLSGQPPSSSVANLQTCHILSPPHQSPFISKRYELQFILKSDSYKNGFSSLVVLSSDDEGSSEPKDPEKLDLQPVQDGTTDNKETEQEPELPLAEELLQDVTEDEEQLCVSSKICLFYTLFPTVAPNKNIELSVDTVHLRKFGLWRNNEDCHSSQSSTFIFLWLSADYVEKIETQLEKSVLTKCSEFVILELFQPLTEREQIKLNEVIAEVSKKNRSPDLSDFLSWKQALPLFKDLSPEESSFMNCCQALFQQQMQKGSTPVLEPKANVTKPSYALLQKQNGGCYSISLSSKSDAEWKEIREIGPVQNLMVYPAPPTKGGLGVTREDLECLEYGEFLNDVIIDFYLKYLLLEKAPKQLAERSHIFSSFFYKCLTRTGKNSEEDPKLSVAQRRHKRVRTWTRHINIFNKDYIFVPVNEESHWYIAVICFPWLEEAVYEDCPNQGSLQFQTQQFPLQSEKKRETLLDSASSEPNLEPCILILDSLKAGSLQNTVQILREYLEIEWEAKRKTHREFSKSTMLDFCPRVPKQDNSSDCGVYLLQYVETFFQDPVVNFELPMHLERWFPRRVVRSKREEIRDLILQLHLQQQSGSSS